jgi:serine/threonine protein phosphatase PrpC
LLVLLLPTVIVVTYFILFVTQPPPPFPTDLHQLLSNVKHDAWNQAKPQTTAASQRASRLRDVESINLPRWQQSNVNDELLDTTKKQSFGRNAFFGSYSYIDGLGCTTRQKCQIHFPYFDLQQMIPFDEALPYDATTDVTDSITAFEHEQEAVVQDTEYPPAIYIPQQFSSKGETAPRLPYQDFALLTRTGTKERHGTANVNQDRVLLVSPFSLHEDASTTNAETGRDWLMGLFDGHGKLGHAVSHFCALDLARLLMKQVQHQQQQKGGAVNMQKVLIDSFIELDGTAPFAEMSGATGIVMWRWNDKLAVANTGDSHGYVISYNPTDDSIEILLETRPHKPDLEEERARIEQLGGQVLPAPPEGGTSRVVIPSNTIPGITLALAMSRSIGDHDGRNLGVIADPTVDVLDLREIMLAGKNGGSRLLFAIAATDGLLDMLASEEIARHLAHSLVRDGGGNLDNATPTLLEACEQLIMKASHRWNKLGESYRDDISIVVSTLS